MCFHLNSTQFRKNIYVQIWIANSVRSFLGSSGGSEKYVEQKSPKKTCILS